MTDKYAKLREAEHPGTQYLAEQLQAAYDKVKEWPENSETGFMDLLTLRNLVPDAIDALAAEKARADAAEAERDRLREGETRLSLLLNENAREAVDAISTLTAERDALKRERDEAREALTRSTIERVRTLIDWLDEHEDNASLLIGSLTAQQIEAARSALSDANAAEREG